MIVASYPSSSFSAKNVKIVNVETIFEGLLELVRLDMQLRKSGKETAERRQVEDAINSVRAKLPEPILGHFDRQKSRGKPGIAPVRGGVCGACQSKDASGACRRTASQV